MDLRRLVQGLIAPDASPPAPYRRERGSLLVPYSKLEPPLYPGVGPGLEGRWSGVLAPSPTDSPVWPYESWLIESFSFDWHYEAQMEPAPIEAGWDPLVLDFTLRAGGDSRWSVTVEKEWPNRYEPKGKFVDLRGSVYANLASPIRLQGGEQFAMGLQVQQPETLELEFSTNRIYVEVSPFRIPYTVDHGGG